MKGLSDTQVANIGLAVALVHSLPFKLLLGVAVGIVLGLVAPQATVITLFGGAAAGILGGNVVIENMFNIPGIGQQLVTALNNRDYPLAQGCTVIMAIFVMIVNLVVDLAYKWCDPRVNLE